MTHTLKLGTVYGTPVFTLQCQSVAVKKVYGATFSGATSSWRFPAFYPVHTIVLDDLKKQVPGILFSPEVQRHVEQLAEDVTLPADFRFITHPYQHQIDGVLHIYRNWRAGLFYAPGLGKCKITVDLQRLTGVKMLIICPLVMLTTWADEFEKHGLISDTLIIDGSKKVKTERIKQAQARVPVATIVTYAVAALYTEELLKIGYDAIILDESHQIKSPFAKRTTAVTALALRAKRRVLLSGTPSLGSPFDMYAQLRFLGTYMCPENWWAFRKMFGVFHESEQNEKVPKFLLGYQNLEIINERVQRIGLKKTKEECLDLPDQQVIDIKFTVYGDQKKTYNDFILGKTLGDGVTLQRKMLEGELSQADGLHVAPHVIADETITVLGKLDQISSGFAYLSTKNPGVCVGCEHVTACVQDDIKPYTQACHIVRKPPVQVLMQCATNARLERCIDLVESTIEEPTNKLIIWANFHAELDDISNALTKMKIMHVRVQGGMPREELMDAMGTFNTDPACRVYLAQVSTGIGVTLNAANYTIYYNLPWSLEHYLQSMDRNYRIGQTRKVTVYRLIGRHTLDDAKATALDQKLDFSTLVTSASVCATCPDYFKRCRKHKIELYDAECKYDRTMMRRTATVRLIP